MINDVITPEFDENGRPLRRIRSFVRRQGRLTKGQQAIAQAIRNGRVRFETVRIDFDEV